MTSSGKVRIYELSRDLGLESRDVLDAAEKLSIAAKSHSSSISDDEDRPHPRLDQAQWQQGLPASCPGKACRGNPNASHPCSVEGHPLGQEGRDTRASCSISQRTGHSAGQACCPSNDNGSNQAYRPQQAPGRPIGSQGSSIVAQDCWRPGKASCRTGQAGYGGCSALTSQARRSA